MVKAALALGGLLLHAMVSQAFVVPKSTVLGASGSVVSHRMQSPILQTSTSLHLGVPSSIVNLQAFLHGDYSFCLTVILLLSTFGISLERRTMLGKALSAPLATMALALSVANMGMIPFTSPVYNMVNSYLVPLAVPMLLFDSDLRRVVRDTGSLLLAFAVGAVATIVGTLVAYPLLPMTSLGVNGWRVACALAARHIGGAINFVAVAETLRISGTAVSAAIAADNLVVAIYFAFLFGIAEPGPAEFLDNADIPSVDESFEVQQQDTISDVGDPESIDSDTSGAITLTSLAMAASVASGLATTGRILTKSILPAGTSALPLTSMLTVAAATIFPTFFQRIRTAGTALGVLCIQMFFAASGAAGSIRLVMQQAPTLFLFSAVQIAIHFCFLITAGRGVLGLPYRELYLASNANVGGPTTAAAMAQAKQWNRLVVPALLIGILGYASATAIALALGPVLIRLPLIGR